jgi:hypothetical protein
MCFAMGPEKPATGSSCAEENSSADICVCNQSLIAVVSIIMEVQHERYDRSEHTVAARAKPPLKRPSRTSSIRNIVKSPNDTCNAPTL